MARPLYDFTARVLAECPSAPGALAELRVRDRAREFCRRTWVLSNTITMNIALTRDYTLVPPADHEIVAITKAVYDGAPLLPTAKPMLDRESPLHETAGGGFRYYLTSKTNLRLAFDPVSAVTNGLVLTSILVPTVDATTLADALYDDWVEAISAGAAADLQRMPKKPWSDLEAAGTNAARFRGGINEARAQYATGQSGAAETAVPLTRFA